MKSLKILLVLVVYYSFANAQAGADSLLNFILNNKDRSAFYVVRNDTVIAKQNEDKMMPLASTVKILVAVEFAKQAGSNVIDAESYVALSELDKYYLRNTDGDAHPNWLGYEREKNFLKGDSVKLIEVARGMTIFSSNANTEYLMDLLGLDNIKSNLQLFGLQAHTAIYPIVSSLFVFQNPHGSNEKKVLKAIDKMSEKEYIQTNIDKLKAAWQNEDAEEVGNAAHTLKAVMVIAGLPQLEHHCKKTDVAFRDKLFHSEFSENVFAIIEGWATAKPKLEELISFY